MLASACVDDVLLPLPPIGRFGRIVGSTVGLRFVRFARRHERDADDGRVRFLFVNRRRPGIARNYPPEPRNVAAEPSRLRRSDATFAHHEDSTTRSSAGTSRSGWSSVSVMTMVGSVNAPRISLARLA